MELLRDAIEDYDFSYNGQTIKLTISVGIYPSKKHETLEKALKLVDGELYKAKENGKNLVSIFE